MKELKINNITPEICYGCIEDVESIIHIEKECFTSSWSEKLILDEISNKNSISFVCKIKGQVAGYIFFRHIFEEGEILRICVSPTFRNMKIASHLMEKALEEGQKSGVEKVFLEVRKSNTNAVALYKKFGFLVYAERSNYYTDNGEDALLMHKIL